MKRIIIGLVIMITGVIIDLSLIITASFYVLGMTKWGGFTLWSAIFGSQDFVNRLSLREPFIIGLILFVIGLIILAKEYLNIDKK
ncbi:MAG: hypothetical protein WCQ54_05400 [Clostridiaceae bacterium]